LLEVKHGALAVLFGLRRLSGSSLFGRRLGRITPHVALSPLQQLPIGFSASAALCHSCALPPSEALRRLYPSGRLSDSLRHKPRVSSDIVPMIPMIWISGQDASDLVHDHLDRFVLTGI
jgi:hypothetical protein